MNQRQRITMPRILTRNMAIAPAFCANAAETAPALLTPHELSRLAENRAQHEEAAALRDKLVAGADAHVLEASDEQLIDLVPNARAKRALFLLDTDRAHGCPIHAGRRYIFSESAKPFRPLELTCSIGKESYPNADFPDTSDPEAPWAEQGWLDTRETVDGKANPTLGKRYRWNAHYLYWGRWMKLGPLTQSLGRTHLLADDADPRTRRKQAMLRRCCWPAWARCSPTWIAMTLIPMTG
jgi:hypothetical protein